MKYIALVLLLVGIVVASDFATFDKFESWATKHGKSYKDINEKTSRYSVWRDNMVFIEVHNSNPENTHTVAMNKFGDLTAEEFGAIYNGYRSELKGKRDEVDLEAKFGGVELPTTVDWRQKGAVTHVKNQGQCGSCWSFSTTGSVEGQHFLATGNLVSLSEQELVDCSDQYGNAGCNGGLMDDAFRYLIAVGGDESETAYPYTARDGTCRFDKSQVQATISSYKDIPQYSESSLQSAAANVGPISVAIDASHSSFQFYNGGVYYEPQCSETQLDHGVLVVGYGTYSGSDYWLVKNSWGADWGLQGYIMMARNKNNNCGIATSASFPIVNQNQAEFDLLSLRK